MSTSDNTVTNFRDVGSCLFCDATNGVQPKPGAVPKVQAWAVTVANPLPHPGLVHLGRDLAAARSVLRGVITLAEQAPELSDEQLRSRLAALGQIGAMTIPAQLALKAPRTPPSPVACGGGADVTGHGLLARFDAGCQCGWCSARAREKTCVCGPCVACRAHVYSRQHE